MEVGFERHFIKTEDVLSGLTAVISIWHPDPQFEGSAKFKLINPEPAALIREGLPEALETFRKAQPEQYQRIVEHIEGQMQERENRRLI
jgi:DNA gyrase subunit B/topoisomerase-4 subunit B